MKDTLESQLPEENGQLEETKSPVEEPGTNAAANVEPNDAEEEAVAPIPAGKLTKEEILAKLTELVETSVETSREDVEALKQAYYKIRRNEVEKLRKEFVNNGNEEKDFIAPTDETEEKIKALLTAYKEKRAASLAEEERVKAANYALKLQLIDQLKALCESQEDFNKLYNSFKEIQQRWKEIKAVPQEHANELWKNYQTYTEKFYDIIKINNQFRDYDFKKNLELKTNLCETVEKLGSEPDVISAFHQLQKLHQQWREIGPVAKDLRESLWQRFKEASSVVNKRHQAHYDEMKAHEQENLEVKTGLCEQVEAIDYTALRSFKEWDEKTKFVIGLQEKWKATGYAPKKDNTRIFERFRGACDVYFQKKSEFYKEAKGEMEKNLAAKRALCEKVEALKDSTDWKETTDKLIALQKEWKTIGPVARKHSDPLWKRFISACDYFFEQKNKVVNSQKSVEQANLAAKRELIAKIKQLNEEPDEDEALASLREYIGEWNQIGFVPFKEKDKIYKEYHAAVDAQFDRLRVSQSDRRMQLFRHNLNEMTTGERGKDRLLSERDKLMRVYERMKSELQTYENNIGFLNISSKGGGGLLKEMERKIEKLRKDMALTINKIDAIDENLE